MINSKKSILAWSLYDWANSAFATTVMAGFFPVFFKEYWSTTDNVTLSTWYLGLGNSIASILVAALAPFIGAIADRGTAKKKLLIFFCISRNNCYWRSMDCKSRSLADGHIILYHSFYWIYVRKYFL